MHNHKFIFICGLHRSATSILFRALREHPEISGFQNTGSPEDEGMHLQSVYKPSGFYGGAGKFAFNPEAHLTEQSLLISAENRATLFREWGQYWDLDKPYLLEKSPPNIIRMRFLQALFPNSYFIVLMRHPIAVSYATRAWYRKYRIYWRRYIQILEHWVVSHEIFEEDYSHLTRIFPLKYEYFVADPIAWMEKIYDFLGLETHLSNQKILPHINEKYFRLWQNDRMRGLSRLSRKRAIGKFEDRINHFGYSLIDLSRVDPVEFLL